VSLSRSRSSSEIRGYGEQFVFVVNLESWIVRSYPAALQDEHVCGVVAGYLFEDSAGSSQRSDVETFIAAYKADGAMLSAALLGQYAGVIVDRSARKACLVQDSFGIRQLFYGRRGDELIVASDLEYCVAIMGMGELDERYFAGQFATGTRPRGTTPYDAIKRLDFGTTLVVSSSGCIALQPWTPRTSSSHLDPTSSAAQLRLLTDQAVKLALPKQGRVVCELSGGLDSTTVLATALRFDPTVEALSIVRSSNQAGDDDRYSREVAFEFGTKRHEIDADLHPHFSVFPDRFAAEPGGETHVAIRQAYDALLVERGFDVVLTGDPGDIVFGYGGLAPVHLADALWRLRLPLAVKSAISWADDAQTGRPWTHLLFSHGLRPAWRHLRRQSLFALDSPKVPEWVSTDLLRRTGIASAVSTQCAPRVALPGEQYLWESLFTMASHVTDSSRLRSPADVRHPLFHRPLVEFMLQVGPEFRVSGGHDRVLQRSALADRLPDSVRKRVTKGSSQEAQERAVLANDDWYRTLTERSRLVERGWVEPRAWRQQVDRARLGLHGQRPNIDVAILTEYWLRANECYRPKPLPPLCAPRAASV